MKALVSMMAALALAAGCATLTEEERAQTRVEWETCIDAEAPELLGFMLVVSEMTGSSDAELRGQIVSQTSESLHEMAVERCGTGHLDAQTRRRHLVAELTRLMMELSGEPVEQEEPDEPS